MDRFPVEVVLRLTVEAPNPKEAIARANDAVTIRPVDDDIELTAIALDVGSKIVDWSIPSEPSAEAQASLELTRRMVEAVERQHPKKKDWEGEL